MKDVIKSHIKSGIDTKEKLINSHLDEIAKAAEMVIAAVKSGKKILFFGNGGSASDAQHLAAEFVGRYEKDRKPLGAIALTTDTSILTAVTNDYAFNQVFTRQIEALGQKGDIAFGISTSGNSENVLNAVLKAKERGLGTIVLTGNTGGKLKGQADMVIVVPSTVTSRIQESHIMIGHIICDLVDRTLFS